MPIRWSKSWIPLCWVDRHSPARQDAKWDGKYYVSHCKFCKKPIVRRDRGKWERIRGELL